MLGRHWALSVTNNLSAAATVTITARLWKFDSSGNLVYSAEQTFSLGSIASGATANTSYQDNSTLLYLGAELTVQVAPSAAVTGSALVQLMRSTDGGTTVPDNGKGEDIGTVAYGSSSSATTRTNMAV